MNDDIIMVRTSLVRKLDGDWPAAALLSVLHHLAMGRPFEEGNLRWVKASIPELSSRTGLPASKVGRTLRKLVSKGALSARVRNEEPNDRTRSYAINMQP
jgi:DNA-binding IclR family transcriptional regulator